mmetsp:Transcript_37514/g.87439  ORF Transcript_37514/g.87439 Transcript_37514/m.87439 type:complete len:561 (+) Transcript_37514:3391-5073(+)
MSSPRIASAVSSSRPPWSSLSLSSRAEHSMPKLSTPRSLPTPILKGLPSSPGGSSAPTVASGTLMPARAFGAPQTICRGSAPPALTLHTRSLSALGCCVASRISATTMPWKGGATGRSSSTSMPDMVSSSASWAVDSGGLQNSRSQDSGNCITVGLLELSEEAEVAVEEGAQVVHAVAQHGQAVDAGAEGEADVTLGVQAHVADDLRVHLTRAGDFQPAALQRAALEHDVDLGAGFGEREVAGAEAQLQLVGLEKGGDEVQVDRLQVLERDVLADPQAFDLVEHRRVGRVAVHAVGAARRNHADLGHGVLPGIALGMGLRIADLHRAGVRAQVEPAAVLVLDVDVERVLHRAGRVVLGVVQRRKAVPVGLDLGAVGHVEAHRREDSLDALHRAGDGMQAAGAALAAGQGDVQGLGLELLLELGGGQGVAAGRQGGFDGQLALIDLGATRLFLFDAQRTQALHQLGHSAGLAEEAGLGVFQFGGRRGGSEIGLGRLQQGVEIRHRRFGMTRVKPWCRRQKGPVTTVTGPESLRAPAGPERFAIRRARPSPWRRCWQSQPGR